MYLHNRLVHNITPKTPFEAYFGFKPDLSCLKLFGSQVCVKELGSRCSKLDQHDFKGLVLGYMATDQNIVYLDLDSGVVKASHTAQFDEAWYLQPSCPPAAQLLYDLGILLECDPPLGSLAESELVTLDFQTPGLIEKILIPWTLMTSVDKGAIKWIAPDWSILLHLPLRTLTHKLPCPITTKAAHTKPYRGATSLLNWSRTSKLTPMTWLWCTCLQEPYHEAFKQTLDLCNSISSTILLQVSVFLSKMVGSIWVQYPSALPLQSYMNGSHVFEVHG
jgi:hypothetical protein